MNERDWLEKIWQEEPDSERERPECSFTEWNQHGETKRCLFKPSPEICRLCLIGELIQMMKSIDSQLENIHSRLK